MFNLLKKIFTSSGKSITTTELENILSKEKITLLDVRSTQEYQSKHIENSQNIPLQNIRNFQGDKSKPVYVICKSGIRSLIAAKSLRKMGYDTINIKGGMQSYKKKNK